MKTILILSGGMDSVTLLYKLINDGDEVKCLSIDYGQRHKKELLAAAKICHDLGVEHKIADLTNITQFLKGSSQTDPGVQVPEGHYAKESMKLTIVPNRNMIMLSIAAAWAISEKYDDVAYAAHAGDHAIYPDCRPEFVASMQASIFLADWHRVKLIGPFTEMTKADIVKLGFDLRVPFQDTWSCYKGENIHCGKCGTCVERKEAFQLASVVDPTVYE